MTTPTTPDEAIEQATLGPQEATLGDTHQKNYSLAELIAAARYLRSVDVATNPPAGFGLRFQKIVPPGAG